MTKVLVLGAIIAIAVWYFRGGATRSEKEIALAHAARIASMAGSWLSGVSGIPTQTVEELLNARAAGRPAAGLERLRAVDYRIVKEAANDIALHVTVAWDAGEGKLRIGKIEERISWSDVPGEAREQMIKRGDHELAYAWIEPPPKAQA